MIGNSLKICPNCNSVMELAIDYMKLIPKDTFKIWRCPKCLQCWAEPIEK